MSVSGLCSQFMVGKDANIVVQCAKREIDHWRAFYHDGKDSEWKIKSGDRAAELSKNSTYLLVRKKRRTKSPITNYRKEKKNQLGFIISNIFLVQLLSSLSV